MAGSYQPLFILIQEFHSDSEYDLDLIRNQLRKCIWLRNNSFGKRRGLLIGVKQMEGVKEIFLYFFDQTMSGLFGVHVTIELMNYSVLNIYHHPDLKVATILQEATWFFSQNPRSINIFGGDFNWDVKEKQMREIEKCCASLHILYLKWDEPTYYKGRCIDHIFFLSKAPLKWLFINAILSSFKDHVLLIGGSSFKEWEIQVNKKSIAEYLINDHSFINTLIERMGTFSKGDDFNEFLIRFKTTAWELVPYWRERNIEVALFRELWKIHSLVRSLQNSCIFRKSTVQRLYSSLEMGLLDQASLGWKGSKKGKLWRREIIPRITSAVLKKIECIEGQLGIFIDSYPAKPKVKLSPRVKGIVVDGVISRDNGVVQKAIKEFWGNLLGSVRLYNKDSLQKLIKNHKPWFPKVDYYGKIFYSPLSSPAYCQDQRIHPNQCFDQSQVFYLDTSPTISPPHWVPPLWGELSCKPYFHCGDHSETRRRYHQQAFWRRAIKF